MRRDRRGVALLEAMVALAILSTAGVSAIALLGAALRSEYELRDRELRMQQADRVLTAMSLLNRADLDRRLGRRTIGEFVVSVQRPERELYRVAISEARDPEVEAMVTVVYRKDGGAE